MPPEQLALPDEPIESSIEPQDMPEITPVKAQGPAIPWSKVENSPEFNQMSILEKNMAQHDYFNEVVIPQLSPDHIQPAKEEFFSQYSYAPKAAKKEIYDQYIMSPEAGQRFAEKSLIGNVLGISPDNIDVSTGATFRDRIDYSFSDTDAEIVNKFSDKYKNGAMFRIAIPRSTAVEKFTQPASRLMFKYDIGDDTEKWKTVEDIDIFNPSVGDVADVAAPMVEAVGTIAIGGLTGGGSIPVQMLSYGGAAAGMHLLKEAEETARGKQLQPLAQVVGEAGIKGGETALLTGAAGLGMKLINISAGRGAIQQNPETAEMLRNITEAKKAGMDLAPLMAQQKAPGSMILGRIGSQAVSTSKFAQYKMLKQKMSAYDALAAQSSDPRYQVQRKVSDIARTQYQKDIRELRNTLGSLTVREGDQALNEGVKAFVENSKKSVSIRYNLADQAAALEKPIFNLTPAIKKGQEIKNLVLGATKDIRETVTIPGIKVKGIEITRPRTKTITTEQLPINVADTPIGKLVGVINDLGKLKPEQANYEVVKQLRTRVGDMVETWPWEASVNKGQAKALYRVLTEVLDDPATKAPNFSRLHKQAAASARARYDFLDSQTVQRQIKLEPAGKLIAQLSKPNELTDVHLALFKSPDYPADKLMRIRTGIKEQIVFDSGGAVKALETWKADKPAWQFLTQGKDEVRLATIASDVDKLMKSNLGELARQDRPVSDVVKELLLKPGTTRQSIADTANMLGPRGKVTLRRAIYEDILTKTETTIKGTPAIDKNKLNAVLKEYKDKGIWDSALLTEKDRTKLTGLKDYQELIFYGGKDPGVSLEAAKAITQLKHPATFIAGAHKLSVNEVMARFLSSKAADSIMFGSGKEKIAKEPLIRATLMLGGVLEGTDQGNKSLPVLQIPTR